MFIVCLFLSEMFWQITESRIQRKEGGFLRTSCRSKTREWCSNLIITPDDNDDDDDDDDDDDNDNDESIMMNESSTKKIMIKKLL